MSLVDSANDYQRAQAAAAEEAARRLGVDVQILFAGGDAIEQSQQLSSVIQSKTTTLNGIVLQPVGTGMQQLARAATAAGIGWVIMHKDVDYIADLRRTSKVPAFMLSSDHVEEGRIQGKQVTALLPKGGTVLGILGPATDSISEQRLNGLKSTTPPTTRLLTVRGKWTEQTGYEAVVAWLRLSTSKQEPIALVACQNDFMAVGAKKAFREIATGDTKERLMRVPIIGCDGLPSSGQLWVKQGLLTATVVLPVLAGTAIDMLVTALRNNSQPKEIAIVDAISYPAIDQLVPTTESVGAFGRSVL
ncbi:MAG TPA: substrate-binding domain-containing protein [Candidatus Dormibacteraeota bacterium]|nr:substrate-binding domain-containing protein [Candidatus Dormibacteraeota bacterium]